MLTQWVVMVLNSNVLCHLQQCKCPDQDLWDPLYMNTLLLATLLPITIWCFVPPS